MTRFTFIAAATALALTSFAHASAALAHEIKFGNLEIFHPWARQAPSGANVAAGFLIIKNNGKEDDRLVSATAVITSKVQIHEMKVEGDVMKMNELKDGIVIPAGSTVELKPGSFHIMFMDLATAPIVNTAFDGTLTFEKAGTVQIDYEVTEPDAGMN